MAIQIRPATLADVTLLNKLGYNIYRSHFRHLWVSESEMNNFLESEYSLPALEKSLRDHKVCWYVAEAESPIGFAKLIWESTIPDTEISGVLLSKLYLEPTETSKGYGQLMFERITALARGRGKNFLWLEVLDQNERAFQFYNKQGMQYIKDTIFKTASQQSIVRIMGISV